MTNKEINAAVARKLGGKPPDHPEQPKYSTDIAAAWKIVDSIKDGKFAIYKDNPDGYTVTDGQSDEYSTILARADTAPLAICKAFLKLDMATQ